MAPTVYPNDRDDAKVLARRLLDAAGPDRHDQVQTTTDGPAGVAFEVPDDVYDAVVTGQAADARPADADGRGGTMHDGSAGESRGLADGADDDNDDGESAPAPQATADAGEAPAASTPARPRRRTR